MLKKRKYQKVEYVHYLENPVRKILLEKVLNGSPSIGAYMMLLEIILVIDDGWFLMPSLQQSRGPHVFLKEIVL